MNNIRKERATNSGYKNTKNQFLSALSFALVFTSTPACYSNNPPAIATEAGPCSDKQELNVDKTKQVAAIDTTFFVPRQEVRQAALSIIRLASDMAGSSNKGEMMVVKVPTYNFVGVLQEMQNRNAKFVSPNGKAPASAKIIFRLEADAGFSQIVYLPN